MSYHKDTSLPLVPETFFHIFNRGNKGIKIFYQERNYSYFLKKYAKALSPYLDTYAYCLIPNHFHFLVRIKSESEILLAAKNDYNKVSKLMWNSIKNIAEEFHPRFFKDNPEFLKLLYSKHLDDEIKFEYLLHNFPSMLRSNLASWIVSDTFRKFFGAYAKAINNQEKENGSLFQKNFRRKRVGSDNYFTHLIWYIHNNGAHHGLVKKFDEYPWSSYHRFLNTSPSLLKKMEVLEWFGGTEFYIDFHRQAKVNWDWLNNVILEEEGMDVF